MSIAVLGSINMDFVAEVKRLPSRGETVQASQLGQYPGGKGANQAVAAARLGSAVHMLGKVGDDDEGDRLLDRMLAQRVNMGQVERSSGCMTGRAYIWVGEHGENSIVFHPGANARVDNEYVDRVFPYLAKARLVLLQLEIPTAAVEHTLKRLPRPGPVVILDPAPAATLDHLRLSRVDFLTPNRGELVSITGKPDLASAARHMLDQGIGCVICKDGQEGCHVFSPNGQARHPAFRVRAVDTTAAGDAFNGALAAALLRGLELTQAIRWANAAGAVTATRKGAQPSLPTLREMETLLGLQAQP